MMLNNKDIKIFAGNSNMHVAKQIASNLSLPLGGSTVQEFADGEISVSIHDSVRGSDIFVIQSTDKPVNKNLMELLIMIDAFKRASAGSIAAVIPYYGYARQDRKSKSRDPISAKLVADLLTTAGADRVLTMDLHAPQIQGFFSVPVDNLIGVSILYPYFLDKFGMKNDGVVVVSPDLGSVTRARNFADRLDKRLAIVDKRRPKPNESEVMNIIGDVKDKKVIIVDDMIDTAGSICNAADALIKKGGASEVYACATHGVLSGPAMERLENSVIKEVVLLDTIAPKENACSKIKYLSVAPVFAEAIARIYQNKPVSTLFA